MCNSVSGWLPNTNSIWILKCLRKTRFNWSSRPEVTATVDTMYSRKLPKCRHDFAHVSKPILWFYEKLVLVPCADSDSIGRHKASGRQESEYRWFLKADTTAFPSSSAITAFYDLGESTPCDLYYILARYGHRAKWYKAIETRILVKW